MEFEKKNFNWGHFFKLGAMGANVLVEFEKKTLIEGIYLKLGAFFSNWGQWGQMC